MIQQKVQLDPEDLEFIEQACTALEYPTKSAYMRQAIVEKIRRDRRKLRERMRRAAMLAYGAAPPDVAFDSIEAEDFEDR